MKKQTKHLLALVLSMMFVGAGVAGGTIAYNAANEPVTASAEGETTYAYSGKIGADATNHSAATNGGLYFRGPVNDTPSSNWATYHKAQSASAVTRIRGGETTEVGSSSVTLIKYNQTSSVAEYYMQGVGTIQEGDVYVLNGDFVDETLNSIITCENVRLKVAGYITEKDKEGNPVQKLRTVVDHGTEYQAGKIFRNWPSEKDNKETGFYFQTTPNDAAYNADWSVAYTPDLDSCVQLTRGGVTYNVGKYDYSGGMFKKLQADGYYFDVGGYLNANFPMQDGDVLTIQGTFRNSTCSITF